MNVYERIFNIVNLLKEVETGISINKISEILGMPTEIIREDIKNIYKDMQMVFQDPIGSFDPRLTIGKSIDELLKNNKVPKNIRKEKKIGANYIKFK